MTIEELGNLLDKYGWILKSELPLEVISDDGQHRATNFAAEVLLEYIVMLDGSDNEEEKANMIERFKQYSKSKENTEITSSSPKEERRNIDFQDGQHY
jgi:hypothetical protein